MKAAASWATMSRVYPKFREWPIEPPDSTVTLPQPTHTTPRQITPATRSTPIIGASPASSISSKRSPSPIISFQPTPLSAESPKGVKNITRKVIKRLEGLGHLEMVDMTLSVPEEEESAPEGEEIEVEKALYALGKEALRNRNAQASKQPPEATNGQPNGVAHPSALKKSKSDLEIPRKVLHGSIGFFTLYLYIAEGDVNTVMLVLWMALAIIVPADLLRFKSRRFARRMKDSINGVVWYILGVNFVLSCYPQDVATVAILILSWADTAASTFGRLYGSATRKLPLAGFTAASITGACIALGFWSFIAPMRAGGKEVTWAWDGGVRQLVPDSEPKSLGGGGALGLLAISVLLVSSVALLKR
ncbi:hypothetical protein CPB84DRAFT_1818714 [Gymnopilus junonius]|uniref:Phosphatidate cytidylyltransferase n=1 Tax=Gymnopilus junonius TaxID=109634 RepID=A0A9P5N6U2_GYMJU|nr:hypothetical protein CPB84DRAFT_1818714 [Gymnopilus junonius]